ncbi:unnamed protein product [marine sediment metagenome]|uniref:Uncharacterized protein n=1 Tax=marine sediment metagenome TaxID=412755 RepID=X1S8W3_9ZZZZ
MRQKSGDIALVEGNNELNVQMTPLPVGSFTYSNVSARMVSFNPAPAFYTMTFSCRVTNLTDATIARTLRLMYGSDGGSFYNYRGISLSLTLAPGQSYNFYFDGNGIMPGSDPYDPTYNGPLISRRTTHCMYLEDEYGNKSAEGCVTRG